MAVLLFNSEFEFEIARIALPSYGGFVFVNQCNSRIGDGQTVGVVGKLVGSDVYLLLAETRIASQVDVRSRHILVVTRIDTSRFILQLEVASHRINETHVFGVRLCAIVVGS